MYREVASLFVTGAVQPLSLSKINRVLRSFAELELFNVGMRNRATGIVAESYRQISGAAAHDAIDKGDGALYHRGHIFGRGQTAHGITTIGLSSLSKIWRLEHTKLPELVQWCRASRAISTMRRRLRQGLQLITSMPATTSPVCLRRWCWPQIGKMKSIETPLSFALSLPLAKSSLRRYSTSTSLWTTVRLKQMPLLSRSGRGDFYTAQVLPHAFPAVHYLDETQPRWQIERGFRRIDFVLYLTDNPARFRFQLTVSANLWR